MIRRRALLKMAVAAVPALIVGSKLAAADKNVSLIFEDSDELLDFIATKSPAAVRVRQEMTDDGSMVWTVLEVARKKALPQGWDIVREKDRFNLSEIDRKQGMIHKFWIKKVAAPHERQHSDGGVA